MNSICDEINEQLPRVSVPQNADIIGINENGIEKYLGLRYSKVSSQYNIANNVFLDSHAIWLFKYSKVLGE